MPVSRDTLCDGERVRELLEESRKSDDVGDNPVVALDFHLRHEYETAGNIFMSDVASALSAYTTVDVDDRHKSPAMSERIRESQSQSHPRW